MKSKRYTYEYPRPSVTVDCVVFGIDALNRLQVLLIERADEPFAGALALPGGFLSVRDDGDQGEELEAAARRELGEETGIDVAHMEQLATFGAPGRDPRGRVISVAFMALVRSKDHTAIAGSDAAKASWVDVARIGPHGLAFDHSAILSTAIERLRGKVRYTPIGFNLLKPPFSLNDLQLVYEAILGRRLSRPNFRKRILDMGILARAGREKNVAHRAATLYRFDVAAYERSLRDGFVFDLSDRKKVSKPR